MSTLNKACWSKTSGGRAKSPQISFEAASGAVSHVVMLYNVDTKDTAWVLTLPSGVTAIPLNGSVSLPEGAQQYKSTSGTFGYDAPVATSTAKVFELVIWGIDTTVTLLDQPTVEQVFDTVGGHVVSYGFLRCSVALTP